MRVEWRSVWRDSRGLCVTVGGTKERHVWYAGRLVLEKEVGMCFIAQQHKIIKCRLPNRQVDGNFSKSKHQNLNN